MSTQTTRIVEPVQFGVRALARSVKMGALAFIDTFSTFFIVAGTIGFIVSLQSPLAGLQVLIEFVTLPNLMLFYIINTSLMFGVVVATVLPDPDGKDIETGLSNADDFTTFLDETAANVSSAFYTGSVVFLTAWATYALAQRGFVGVAPWVMVLVPAIELPFYNRYGESVFSYVATVLMFVLGVFIFASVSVLYLFSRSRPVIPAAKERAERFVDIASSSIVPGRPSTVDEIILLGRWAR